MPYSGSAYYALRIFIKPFKFNDVLSSNLYEIYSKQVRIRHYLSASVANDYFM